MADDQEKTEEPTSKKIEDARKEGNVPKSQDTSSFATLFVAIIAFLGLFSMMERHIVKLYIYLQSFIGVELTKNTVMQISIATMGEMLLIILPLAIIVAFFIFFYHLECYA